MNNRIKTVYVVHHSHTDIGYTDLQERVIRGQVNYIRSVLDIFGRNDDPTFKWNCETWFFVEKFLAGATGSQKDEFFRLVKDGRIGLSANYLNFTDLADCAVLRKKIMRAREETEKAGAPLKCAMTADINGISMGQRDVLIDCGVEFLYMNIHCHHGMYPLFKNQTAYFWENAEGKRLLVWNGEHYHLGNRLGIRPNRVYVDSVWREPDTESGAAAMRSNLKAYLDECENEGYPYDFIIISVSGVYSDNSPPEPEIARVIEAYNRMYPDEAELQMVTLGELYDKIRDRLSDSPVYRGDLTDWWANGVGSTPYALKHFKQAQHRYSLCSRLDAGCAEKYPALAECAEENLLLYAEHTWGHSSTITNPCDTMVLNLDMRKTSYASKAHESASMMLTEIAEEKGDTMRYYNTEGNVTVYGTSDSNDLSKIEFYIENFGFSRAQITDESGAVIPCQVSGHPRGRLITFFDRLEKGGAKKYFFRPLPDKHEHLNSRYAYVGAERIRDIENSYDKVTYMLPYSFENDFFKLSYSAGKGVTGFIDKATGRDLLRSGTTPFFTPIYERTALRDGIQRKEYEERRLIGRNIRGRHAKMYEGTLEEVNLIERGDIFSVLEFRYTLPGTSTCKVYVRLYENTPRIDFTLAVGKTLSSDIESVFMPLSLEAGGGQSVWIKKGSEPFRPGIDQIPGSCMEYYMSDYGVTYVSGDASFLIACRDCPLIYAGSMEHHPIRLCDNLPVNNSRPLYSWVMNNTWETNFKMDLSGFCEFNYTMWRSGEKDPLKAVDELTERCFDPFPVITG